MSAPADTTPRGQVAALVRDVVCAILPGLPATEVTEDRNLKDLGADSVDRVEIILGLLGQLGLDEPMSSFSGMPDIGALIDFLTGRSQP